MKRLFAIGSLLSALLCAGPAAATPYVFEDLIDDWTIFDLDAVPIIQGHPLHYQHNILDDGFTVGDEILYATLEFDFTNDRSDAHRRIFGFRFDFREFVSGSTGGSPFNLGEVDNGQHTINIDVALLANGTLDVWLGVNNPLGTGTVWLDHSKLSGSASAVPEPATLALMGLGILGIGFARRKCRARSV